MAALTPRDAYLRRTYGITEAEYQRVLDAQHGACAICLARPAAGRNLHVDHDHRSGIVRGLLCVRCNHELLGRRDKDPDLFYRAGDYLENPPAVAVLGPREAPSRPRKRTRKRGTSRRSG